MVSWVLNVACQDSSSLEWPEVAVSIQVKFHPFFPGVSVGEKKHVFQSSNPEANGCFYLDVHGSDRNWLVSWDLL